MKVTRETELRLPGDSNTYVGVVERRLGSAGTPRPVQELAADVVQDTMLLGVCEISPTDVVELAKAVLFWSSRADANSRDRERARTEAQRLRDALRIAETTRNAAQDIATRETELRRNVECEVRSLRERLQRHEDGVEGFLRWCRLSAEADAMRELAWRWCIEAAEQRRTTLLAECERAFERATVAELRLEVHRLRGTP